MWLNVLMKRFCGSLLLAVFCTSPAAAALNLQEFRATTAVYHTSTEIETILADSEDLLTRRLKKNVQVWLDRSNQYLPLIKATFSARGLPEELAYLPLIESGFSIMAVSEAKAVGLWQFIEETGRRYGLRIDAYLDERRDPIKSTSAAADYLTELYAQFGSWPLALAAYNCGENQVQRISAKVGEDIWKFRRTPLETRKYVPLFLTALAIAKDPKSYGFESPKNTTNIRTQDVFVRKSIQLKVLAKKYKIKLSVLRSLNPSLLTDVTPPYQHILKVPA